MNHGRSRLRVVAVCSALGAVAAGGITVMSCEPDHNRDVPGPPKIISAYVTDLKANGGGGYATASTQINGGTCDGTDPRMFGGGFVVHDQADPTKSYNVRCYPDLLAPMPDPNVCGPGCGDTGPFSYATQLRVVFSEGLNGDLIEDQDNVKLISTFHPGVISGMAGGMNIPIITGQLTSGELTTYYDPAGADFKQGIYGTAPPGPSIVVTPGENLPDGTPRVFGLPSGSASMICFDATKVKDTAGNGLGGQNCLTVMTSPLTMSTAPGDSMGACNADPAMSMCDQVSFADLVGGGVTVQFTAPIVQTDIADATMAATNGWLTITYMTANGMSGTLSPTCYSVAATGDPADATLPTADALIATVSINVDMATGAPTCAQLQTLAGAPAAFFPITVTVTASATKIKDQYGVQLATDATHQFQIKPPATTDAGAF